MDERPLNVVSLSRKEFDNQRVRPDNYLFFVYDGYVTADRKAKTKISLYKGSILVCGDLYEAIINLNKEVDALKAAGGNGGGKIDLKIGTIVNSNDSFPKAEIVYDEESKTNRLNIGFPLRYKNVLPTPGAVPNLPSNVSLSLYNLYPPEIHNSLEAVIYEPTSQLLSGMWSTNKHLVFIEDYYPIGEESIVKSAPYLPILYRRLPYENMAVDYQRFKNTIYPVIRGGSPYLMSGEKTYIQLPGITFEEQNDRYISSLYLHKQSDGVSETEMDRSKNYAYAEKEEWNCSDGVLSLKGEKGSVNIVLEFGIFYDELNRFLIDFEVQAPDKIEFKAINKDGEDVLLFSIDMTTSNRMIEFTPYGIRSFEHGRFGHNTIVFAGDMKEFHYTPDYVRKISFHFSRYGSPDVNPSLNIHKGSFLDFIMKP